NLARGCAALAGWDRRYELSSRGAALFRAFWAKAGSRNDLWAVQFDPADPVNTPRDLATAGAKGERLLATLAEAVADLDKAGIALDAPWGDVQRWTASSEAIPIHGGPGTAGVLNYQDARPSPAGGLVPVHGTSYIQIVGFDQDGPVADAILSYSQSTDPASPHFVDQTRLYSRKEWHRLPFSREEIAAQRIGKPKRIAQ
ncbi:MAG: penicillin acylase family protein, partial [Erythrobacter sp.]|nr:penicillin acylase family protein [Erythrobacter sp.]